MGGLRGMGVERQVYKEREVLMAMRSIDGLSGGIGVFLDIFLRAVNDPYWH